MKKLPTKTQKIEPQEKTSSSVIVHRNLTVIEVAETELLDILQADRKVGPLIIAKLSDKVALVAASKASLFIKNLLKAGHTPKIK